MAENGSSPSSFSQAGAGFSDLRRILHSYWLSILLIMILGTGLTGIVVWRMVAMYRAEAVVLLEIQETRVAELNPVIQEPDSELSWAWLARSEGKTLQSEDLIRQVIDRLDLLHNPAFQSEPNPADLFLSEAADLLHGSLTGVLAGENRSQQGRAWVEPIESNLPTTVGKIIEAYERWLTTSHDDETFILRVAFEAPDPALAAEIANTHATIYLESQKERKTAAVTSAYSWLDQQVQTHGDKLRRSEEAVQRFRAEHNLIDVRADPGVESAINARLSEVNLALARALTDLSAKDARLQEVKAIRSSGADPSAVTEVIASPVIQGLRQQEALLRSAEAGLATTIGREHPQRRSIDQEIGDLGAAIAEEMLRIEASLAQEVNVARQATTALKADLAQLEQQAFQDDADRITLRELDREAATNQHLFQGLLDRYKEVIAQANLSAPDGRLVSAARAPEEPFRPKTKVLLAFALVVSAGIGIGQALARERINVRAYGPDDVAHAACIPCLATLPAVSGPRGHPAIEQLVMDSLQQVALRYLEAIRSVRALVERTSVEGHALRILVTSSLPREGKTTFSVALAQEMARAGRRTLLIDADLRRGGALKLLIDSRAAAQASVWFSDGMRSNAILKSGHRLGFEFLSLAALMSKDNAPAAAAADKLLQLLAHSEGHFERILIDCAPVTAVADPILFAPLVDVTVLVVHWQETRAALLRAVTERLALAGARQVNAVLNRVDLKKRSVFSLDNFDRYYNTNRAYYSSDAGVLYGRERSS